MKKLIALALIMASILFSLPAQASMLMPTGGWLLDATTRIRTYTDYAQIYRMSAEKIVNYDREGSPLVETITWVDAPFDTQSTALGFRHCKTETEDKGVVAVYSMADDVIKYSWIFNGKGFKKIPTGDVTCNKQLLLD